MVDCGSTSERRVVGSTAQEQRHRTGAMSTDDKISGGTNKVALPDFPGEDVLSHEGLIWKRAAVTKLAPYELVVVAETGHPPALDEIVDASLDDFPVLPLGHPQYERRMSERNKIAVQNASNYERRKRITLRAWTTLFESLRSACTAKAPLLADELYDLCALDARGISGGYFDGPRAWRIICFRIEGEGERTETDKDFYSTALTIQKSTSLENGCTALAFQKKAFAFVQYIMPNLAQPYGDVDASEYILKLLPKELYEAGQRVKFSAKMAGRFTDHKYLIRLLYTEVFNKQKASPPQPTFVAFEQLGGHDIGLLCVTSGIEDLQTAAGERAGHAAFAGGVRRRRGGKVSLPEVPAPKRRMHL